MVISADEKKILLARLEKARETKAAKAAAKKKETLADVKEPEPPAPVPAPVAVLPPAPAPIPVDEKPKIVVEVVGLDVDARRGLATS